MTEDASRGCSDHREERSIVLPTLRIYCPGGLRHACEERDVHHYQEHQFTLITRLRSLFAADRLVQNNAVKFQAIRLFILLMLTLYNPSLSVRIDRLQLVCLNIIVTGPPLDADRPK